MPTIKIHYFSDDLPRLQKTGKGDWIDLYAAQTMQLRAGDFALIPLGVSMQLPEGYEAHIVPRPARPRVRPHSSVGAFCRPTPSV